MRLSIEQLRAWVEQYRQQFGTQDDRTVAPIFYLEFPCEKERRVKESVVFETRGDEVALILDIDDEGYVVGIEFF